MNQSNVFERYWNEQVHDSSVTAHQPGTLPFFQALATYRFGKQTYLRRIVSSTAYEGKRLLEVGCSLGTDLVPFARAGARVTGVDISRAAIEMARRNFSLRGLSADFFAMDGHNLEFSDGSFDVVYCHTVLNFSPDPRLMIKEMRRVIRPEGELILAVFNRLSWLNLLSQLTRTELGCQDAPVFQLFTSRELGRMLSDFQQVRVLAERFPVPSPLHHGLKGFLYNQVFVPLFSHFPRPLVRPFGWHLLAFARR